VTSVFSVANNLCGQIEFGIRGIPGEFRGHLTYFLIIYGGIPGIPEFEFRGHHTYFLIIYETIFRTAKMTCIVANPFQF
jgi:hypothetical protein